MRAHKVPATYYSGWKVTGNQDSFYVFYKNNLSEKGILKPFRRVRKITTEHGYFMDEDFYYIDFSIKGISFKLQNEINDFLNQRNYSIQCVDTLADGISKGNNIVIVDDYFKFMAYINDINSWTIKDNQGNEISKDDFNEDLSNYIFDKIGIIIEENYFANYLENMWPDIKNSILRDTSTINSGDNIMLSRKNDLLEFFVIQYLRLDKRIKTDITPKLKFFEKLFLDIGADNKMISEMKDDGLLVEDVYFFGVLLDAARGDKRRINNQISEIDKNYYIDILKAPSGFGYLTSTSPCIFSKVNNNSIEEMLFPISSEYCLRFRNKKTSIVSGKYIIQSAQDVKDVNNHVANTSEDIVISNLEYINILI